MTAKSCNSTCKRFLHIFNWQMYQLIQWNCPFAHVYISSHTHTHTHTHSATHIFAHISWGIPNHHQNKNVFAAIWKKQQTNDIKAFKWALCVVAYQGKWQCQIYFELISSFISFKVDELNQGDNSSIFVLSIIQHIFDAFE